MVYRHVKPNEGKRMN